MLNELSVTGSHNSEGEASVGNGFDEAEKVAPPTLTLEIDDNDDDELVLQGCTVAAPAVLLSE